MDFWIRMMLREQRLRAQKMAASGGANLNLGLEMAGQQALAASSSSDAVATAQQYLAENKANQSSNLIHTQSSDPLQQTSKGYDSTSMQTLNDKLDKNSADRAESGAGARTGGGAADGGGAAGGGGAADGKIILGGRGHWNDLLDVV